MASVMGISVERLCRRAPGNNTTWQQDFHEGHCYEKLMIFLPSHCLLGIISAFYVIQITSESGSQSLKQSVVLRARFFIASLYALLQLLNVLLRQVPVDAGFSSVDHQVDCLVFVAWFLQALYQWKLRCQSSKSIGTHKPVIIAWFLTLLAVFSRLTTILGHVLSGNRPVLVSEDGLVIVWTALHFLYLISLCPTRRHAQTHEETGADDGSSGYVSKTSGEEESMQASPPPMAEPTKLDLGAGEDSASLLSKLTFWWTRPLLCKGAAGQLSQPEDVFHLSSQLSPSRVEARFATVYPQSSSAFAEDVFASKESDPSSGKAGEQSGAAISNTQTNKPSLRWAMVKMFGPQMCLLAFFKVVVTVFIFAGPLMLSELLFFIENGTEPKYHGYYYATKLFLAIFLFATLDAHFHYRLRRLMLNVRSALVSVIYRKSLAVSATTLSAFTTGQIMNFMTSDTDAIAEFPIRMQFMWILPVEMAGSFYLIYKQVGVSFLAGVGLMMILLPITKFVSVRITKAHKRKIKQLDRRVKVMTEILKGIRVIKFYAWEAHFKEQVGKWRSKELRSVQTVKYLECVFGFTWGTTPILLSILTFSLYTLLGNELTAAKVFTCLSLFRLLVGPLTWMSGLLNCTIESWVALKRVQKFLDLKESDFEEYYRSENCLAEGECLKIAGANFHWEHPKRDEEEKEDDAQEEEDSDDNNNNSKDNALDEKDQEGEQAEHIVKLEDIDLSVHKGQFVGIVGQVGSGKSSLFAAITADMVKEGGSIAVAHLDRGFGLATQEPWLQQATLKENILFGKALDADWYDRVIEACALKEDLKILPSGDETEIGENGVTLSGGQKARVALARAVYQDSDIYLLDDPLAAVDVHVGQHIYSKCIMGLLRHKTRILCTHHTKYLTEADLVVVMDGCKVTDVGECTVKMTDRDICPPDSVLNRTQNTANLQFKESATKSSDEDKSAGADEQEKKSSGKLVEEEEKEQGVVKFDVYKMYLKAVSSKVVLAWFALLLLIKASSIFGDWWLSQWTFSISQQREAHTHNASSLSACHSSFAEEIDGSLDICHSGTDSSLYIADDGNTHETTSSLVFYLGIYAGIVAVGSLFTLALELFFAHTCVKGGSIIHEKLLDSVLKAPISFFDSTPLGRIINRFSSDVRIIDSHLPGLLCALQRSCLAFVSAIAVTCSGLPWFSLCLIPAGALYYFLQQYYRMTSREVRRIRSTCNSAIASHFSETLAGLPVIRAMRASRRFQKDHQKKQELFLRARYNCESISFWLWFQLQMIGIVMVTVVALMAVAEHQYRQVDPGMVGMVLSYAMSISHILMGSIMQFTEMEKQMVSTERTKQYIEDIAHERQGGRIKPPAGWPSKGVVKFDDVQFSYRNDHPKALDGVSFETRPGEKVGIVGRTGSGKSTLFLALFRMVEAQGGRISVDGVDLADLSLEEVRSRLAIIPQDPFLFCGTVQENLDPVGQFTDQQLWSALEKCHLGDVVKRMGGLKAQAGEGGKLFSNGQRQLLCLARAMLTKAKVLCIDEATASVDMETDEHLQRAIREEFKESTVLTIAHRINTITDSDRILVMGGGRAVEFGEPNILSSTSE
ncbi:ATP-binding cassette sub-family C member 10-like [Diadema antillarum]|uniref:ATP-binding cassette sub-family C member 10-like n=1 Tax=Diadema antillarum TaxID=105358 RepID=UPI003A8372D7